MDADLSHDLTRRMPIVPHEAAGVECCGCIIAAVDGTNVELRCNECGAVVGVVQVDILKGLLGLECATATCPHRGKESTFPGFTKVSTYMCAECGKAVGAAGPESESEWVEIHELDKSRAHKELARRLCAAFISYQMGISITTQYKKTPEEVGDLCSSPLWQTSW